MMDEEAVELNEKIKKGNPNFKASDRSVKLKFKARRAVSDN